MVLGQLDIHIGMPKNKVIPLPHIIYQNQLKIYQTPNVWIKTIKLLEDNIEVNLQDLVFGNGFLDITPKAHTAKEENRK